MAIKSLSESVRDWNKAAADRLCSLGWHFFFDSNHCSSCGIRKFEVSWLARHKGMITKIAVVSVFCIPAILAVGIVKLLGYAIGTALMLAFFCAVTYGVGRLFRTKSRGSSGHNSPPPLA